MDELSIISQLAASSLILGTVVLFFSAVKKIWANFAIRRGETTLFGLIIPDWMVVLVEAIVITAVLLVMPIGNYIIGLYFIALFIVALKLHGNKCNCFGISKNSIDLTHLLLLITIALVNIIFALITAPVVTLWSALLGLLAGIVILLIWQSDRSNHGLDVPIASDFSEFNYAIITRITILFQEGCVACDALKRIINKDLLDNLDMYFDDAKNSEIAQKHKIASFPAAVVEFTDESGHPQSHELYGISEITSFLSNRRK